MKTSDLIGRALDWAVAAAQGIEVHTCIGFVSVDSEIYDPSEDWALGGPIIERERISILMAGWDEVDGALPVWQASSYSGREVIEAHTPLVAAMRCFVASRLGEEVDVPEELR
jgi:hypothetical protein